MVTGADMNELYNNVSDVYKNEIDGSYTIMVSCPACGKRFQAKEYKEERK